MHSRKSIINKGIVFIMSIFAMAIFSFTKVGAADCEVSFKDEHQYLVIGGNSWEDSGIVLNEGCSATEFKVNSITVNGGEKEDTHLFTISSRPAGHYTVGYNYSYLDSSSNKVEGVVYRYVRLLNSSFDTSSNYTLAQFDFNVTSSVIDSYNINDKYFVNFVATNTSTYVVVKNALGITLENGSLEIKHSTLNFVASRVIKNGDYFYLVGSDSEGKGVCLSYKIVINEGALEVTPAASYNSTSIYNNVYVNTDGIYLVGKTNTGFPVIDRVKDTTLSTLYTHNVKGEYKGVVVVNKVVYAVGYTKGDSDSNPTGLYTYFNESDSTKNSLNVLGEGINTIFNDIVYDAFAGRNIVVGESVVNQIYANGALVATNTRQGYKDGVILKISLDGTSVSGAYMFGGNVDDSFTKIRLFKTATDAETEETYNIYYVTGNMDNGIANLVYSLNVGSQTFSASNDKTSSSSTYMVNGVVAWSYGYAYYGSLSDNTVLGVYYPREIVDGKDSLLIVLDNRSFTPFTVEESKSVGYETINIVKNDPDAKLSYCYYLVRFGGGDYESTKCIDYPSDSFDHTQTMTTSLEYLIPTNTGSYIYVYRVVNVVEAPVPTNLSSGYTGILKWYTYNRSYVYTPSNVTRREIVDYKYTFTGNNADKTIYDMIDYYLENNNTAGYNIVYKDIGSIGYNTFEISNQTSAAFASIEYAKKFAYYQEFSRVVKVSGEAFKGAETYNGQAVDPSKDYYIYYIDYKGNNASEDVGSCLVTSNYIDNCSAKGGYAFTSLDAINSVIQSFLQYNNYFVSTRNTIYNGSIAASEIDAYNQELITKEYLTRTYFTNRNNLTFNVAILDESDNPTLVYQGTQKTVLFGGSSKDDTSYTHPQLGSTQTVTKSENGYYFENSNYIFFEENKCYEVYYSYGETKGTSRVFCLDTKAPEIVYKKDNSDDPSIQTSNDDYGTSKSQPLKVESDFTITDLVDLDEYAFIRINGVVYPITCNDNSESCLNDVNEHIKRTFRYNVANPGKVEEISFSDRLLNTNTFYFVIGTIAPSISIENETNEGFTLVIDFYDTNAISSVAVNVYPQLCASDSVNCYSPDKSDTKAITYNYSKAFNEALTNYIYAIGYRDNTSEDTSMLEIEAKEGIYTIDGINYIIKDGYFVETEESQTKYTLDANSNMFKHEGIDYSYNPALNVIQTLKEVDGEYEVDTSKNIPVIDNKFKFDENSKEYQIIKTEEATLIQSVPLAEEIYNENQFTLNDIIYTVDFENEILSYSNPELSNMKHIELEFVRTTDDKKGNITGGIQIPKTVQIMEEDGVTPVKDPITSLLAYKIVEEEYLTFYLVDGVYQFTISQSFEPRIKEVETTINVKDLKLDVGYAVNHSGLKVVTGAQTDFEATEDVMSGTAVTVLALARLEDNFKYPLNPVDVASSNLGAYQDTHFINRTIYASYTPTANTITTFSIKVYEEKNSYGLPKADKQSACKEVIIYHGSVEPSELNIQSCSTYTYIHFNDIASTENVNILTNLGITHVLGGTGTFAFSGENKFYNISLREYAEDSDGNIAPSTKKIGSSFYIDSINPIDTTHTTISANVYDTKSGDQDITLTDKTFEFVNGTYQLNSTVGSTVNVGFKVNWYDGSSIDYKENKLMLISIVTSDGLVTCNLYQLISNKESNPCGGYIDIEETKVYVNDDTTRNESIVVFSATGNYEITFKDASGNSVTYTFTIDKSAPEVELSGASMEVDGNTIILNFEAKNNNKEYYVLAYTNNPTFTITLIDLSPVSKYCYYFDYGQASKTPHCVDSSATQHTFSLREYIVNSVDANKYLTDENADKNVRLVIWAKDALGNGEEDEDNDGTPDKSTVVSFWVDYKNPTTTFNKTDLNTTYVTSEDIETNNQRYNTISVFSSEYSGRVMVCEDEFRFNDTRNGLKYEFAVLCEDIHNTSSTSYPITYGFTNTIYMKFYESDGTKKLADEFNFGLPTVGGNARWIYITTVDSVGNESSNYIIVPIFVQDEIPPAVVASNKVVDEEKIAIAPVTYAYQENKNSLVYLANNSIEITFGEPIAKIKAFSVALYKEGNISSITCSKDTPCDGYYADLTFSYSNANPQVTFTFANINKNEYKIIIFVVEDFAGLPSQEVVVIIDRINPNIEFNQDGGNDDTIEYITNKKIYSEEYMSNGYREHIVTSDDQKAPLDVEVKYYIYSPRYTHNNYIYANREYRKVNNGTQRSTNTKYYLLVKETALNNKSCAGSTTIDGVKYCYVEDTQSYYYFDELLDDTSGNYWNDIGTLIDSSKIGVYRISYVVTDYAGNTSKTIYKKVFVNDTEDPDIDIYKDNAATEAMYTNLTSTNDSNFEGKLNMSVTFKGKDTSVSADTRIVLYRCGIDEYKGDQCVIDQPLFSDNAGVIRGESFSNVYNIGKKLNDGVYKAFVYDVGQYLSLANADVVKHEADEGDIYSLTHNARYFYFAVKVSDIDAKYEVHGNKFSSGYDSYSPYPYISYVQSDTNYYVVKNGTKDSDVYLVVCNKNSGECVDRSAGNMIGYMGGKVEFNTTDEGKTVTVVYYNNSGLPIYEVNYEQYSGDLLLHETYHSLNLASKNAKVCKYINGKNECEDEEYVYKVTGVTATIYEEGTYLLKYKDRYGNLSQDVEEFTVDNKPYLINKNENLATGVNYWFSVPSQVVTKDNSVYLSNLVNVPVGKDINPLESKYEGNFNSEFFYAFASYADAKSYLTTLYQNEVEKQLSKSGFTFYGIDGNAIKTYTNVTTTDVMSEISSVLTTMIFPTFTYDERFDDKDIKQVAYVDSNTSSSMYKYVYVLVKETITNGVITRNYSLVEDETCIPGENEQCIKVDLKIVSATNTSISLSDGADNNISCLMSGTGGSSSGTGLSACNQSYVTTGAKYIFIDTDVSNYHENTVFYGIVAYTDETIKVVHNELGGFVSLDKFVIYSEPGVISEDRSGRYILVDSEYVLIDEIMNTNLYDDGKVYVTYLTRFDLVGGKYNLSTSGEYYYDYATMGYALVESLDISYTFSDAGNKCEGRNCTNIPYIINSTTITEDLTNTLVRPVNKKTYIELFSHEISDVDQESNLFEINAIVVDGKYSEVYSYATLGIRHNSSDTYTYYNINNFIVIDKDKTRYRCTIDIDLESYYDIIIIDRAGNRFNMVYSHSDVIPTMTYEKENPDSTSSNVTIKIETTSEIANLTKNNIKILKHNGSSFEEEYDAVCLGYIEDISNVQNTKVLTIKFNYNVSYDCAGVYRIEVIDSHGNTNYKEFVFNPYDLTTSYVLDSEEENRIYAHNFDITNQDETTTTVHGVIINKVFRVDVDANRNYLVVSRYPAYSVANLTNPVNTITISDFTTSYTIGSCPVTIERVSDNIYSISVNGLADHSCDGIYTVDVINRFSRTILDSQFMSLEGANQELITSRVTYYDSTSVEIDTTAPDSTYKDGDSSYFSVIVDGETNVEDTTALIENKTIYYTNKYITISWGGLKEHSFTSLKYRVKSNDDPNEAAWSLETLGTTYDGNFASSYTFKIISPGVYTCEFRFVDVVGNEDANQTYTLVITIKAPNVGFFEVNETGTEIGEQYEYGARIGERTILRCIDEIGSGSVDRPCTLNDYKYVMLVNGTEYPGFNDNLELADVISRKSYWLVNTPAQYAEELQIKLIVSIIGKDDITTELSIIIDKKAPVITVNGVTVNSTYIGVVTVNLSNEDASNVGKVYACDSIVDDECLVYASDKTLVSGKRLVAEIEEGAFSYTLGSHYSGYFMVEASDNLGNTSSTWFTLDNKAPTITVTAGNTIIAPNMYTNAKAVFVTINDELSTLGATFEIEFTPLHEGEDTNIEYNSLIGLTKEGKYTITPKDGVNNKGRSISFYIYRQAPKYTITTNNEEDTHVVNTEVSLSWLVEESELVAPIVSVTIDGKLYNAVYDSVNKKYVGVVVTEVGDHTFVITDTAGNRSLIMVTINNTNKVCINGIEVEVKMQAYYNVDSLLIGSEKGVKYELDDVVIFALPSQVSNGDCAAKGLLGYRTLDPENSHYLIDTDRNAALFNNNKYDFVEYGFISQEAINEIKNVGGTVVVFVVTKDIANNELGYTVGTNFFLEDPIGWTMIFVSILSLVWPVCRIFIKKKVRVI